jgi:hypothetical protein
MVHEIYHSTTLNTITYAYWQLSTYIMIVHCVTMAYAQNFKHHIYNLNWEY